MDRRMRLDEGAPESSSKTKEAKANSFVEPYRDLISVQGRKMSSNRNM